MHQRQQHHQSLRWAGSAEPVGFLQSSLHLDLQASKATSNGPFFVMQVRFYAACGTYRAPALRCHRRQPVAWLQSNRTGSPASRQAVIACCNYLKRLSMQTETQGFKLKICRLALPVPASACQCGSVQARPVMFPDGRWCAQACSIPIKRDATASVLGATAGSADRWTL